MPAAHLGLTTKQAQKLLLTHGKNELTATKKTTPLQMFIAQFKNILMVLLIVASVVSFAVHEAIDGLFILLIVILNAILGFVQEFKAENAIAALKKMAVSQVRVIRDGKEELIDSALLVPGDIIRLAEGDRIPADGELIDSLHFEVNEASITGESMPVHRNHTEPENSRIFMGTIVARGKGLLRITSTGMDSRFGRMASSLTQITKEDTPLSRKIAELGKILTIVAVVVTVVLFLTGLATNRPLFEMLLTSISLAVAAVPEGLPAVITITLAVGLQRMARQKAILRKLAAIESLGNTTVIATDKTGTLTENKMKVVKLWTAGTILPRTSFANHKLSALQHMLIKCGIVCNDAALALQPDSGTFNVLGDQTEGSLLLMAHEFHVEPEKVREQGRAVDEYGFDATLKRMSVVWEEKGKLTVFTKGAPESILSLSTSLLYGSKPAAMTARHKKEIEQVIAEFAREGLRVLALACKDVKKTEKNRIATESNLTFLGLVGIADPARENVAETIAIARHAGIETIMITGDNAITAQSIGYQVQLAPKDATVLTGDQIRQMADSELAEALDTVRIFARTNPEDKYRIVKLLQSKGHVVTVTGDGVNDALALKQADVGVAMGITGTDVAKEVADMVVTDDNFVSIVNAVKEGRVIFQNIVKSIVYLVSCNLGEIGVLTVAIMLRLPMPLLPIHLLWINLVTDGLPALSLAFDPATPAIMGKQRRSTKLIGRHNLPFIIGSSSIITLITMGTFTYVLQTGSEPIARMAAFNTLIILQMAMVFLVRKGQRLFSNPLLLVTVTISLVLQMIITTFPPLRLFFRIQ